MNKTQLLRYDYITQSGEARAHVVHIDKAEAWLAKALENGWVITQIRYV